MKAGLRRITRSMVWLRLWVPCESMRLIWLRPRWGTRWLLRILLRRQGVDELKHAPCCPANHYHRQRLVFQRCSCGASRIMYSDTVTVHREVDDGKGPQQAPSERRGDGEAP